MLEFDELKGLVLQGFNGLVLAGAVFVKAPQLINIWRIKSVAGLSEESVAFEALATGCGVMYNILQKHPFATWGELAFLSIQCKIQLAMYWYFTTLSSRKGGDAKQITVYLSKRGVIAVMYFLVCGAIVSVGKTLLGGEAGTQVLGMIPTVLGTGSRIPQVLQNFKQGHTGSLSIITWFMSLGGCVVRVITTLALVPDKVTLFGHAAALVVNFVLVAQIALYWNATNAFIEKTKKDKEA